jgi:hypothetical protein
MAMTVCLLKVPLNYLKALQCHFKLKKVEGPFNKAQPLDNVQDRSSSNTSGSTTSSDIFEGAKKNHAISSQVLGER